MPKTIPELRRERELLRDEALTYLDGVEKEKRSWGDEDEEKFKKLTARIEDNVRTEERLALLEGFKAPGDLGAAAGPEAPQEERKIKPSGFRSLGLVKLYGEIIFFVINLMLLN